MRLWPRLHFGDGGTLDLAPVDEWQCDSFEQAWRALHVRVEWLRSPGGRLDHLLPRYVTWKPQDEAASGSPPE